MQHALSSSNQQDLTNLESKPSILMMIKEGNTYKIANFRRNHKPLSWMVSNQGLDTTKPKIL